MISIIRCSIFRHRNQLSQLFCRYDASISEEKTLKNKRFKIDRSKVPLLNERDLEEHYVSGSGPGGQNVNKSVNACFLKHLPTGLSVKVHQSRSLFDNRKIARELLIQKLDNHFNGENSVTNQKKRRAEFLLSKKELHKEHIRSLKEQYKNKIIVKNTGPQPDAEQ